MNVVENTQANIDLSNIGQTSQVGKPEAVQSDASVKSVKTKNVQKAENLSKKDIQDMVEVLQDLTETLQTKLNFSIDDGTNNIVVKVIDQDTDKIVRQFPPEELLELQEKMQDLTGFLYSGDA